MTAKAKKVITKVTTTKVVVSNGKGKVEKVIHKPVKVTKKAVPAKKPAAKKVVKKTTTVAKKPVVQKVSIAAVAPEIKIEKKSFWTRILEFFGF